MSFVKVPNCRKVTPAARCKHISRTPSAKPPFAPQKPAPSIDPRLLQARGGTIRVDIDFYLRRTADDRIETAAQRGGETVVIKGPRQVGKSSLMVRYLKTCADAGRRFAFFDFQILNGQQLDDYPTLLTWIARSAARRLRVQLNTEPDIGAQVALNNFIEDTLIPMVGGPITLAFDEVDRVLGRPYHADFFSMLRLWHNQRAEPFSAWENVDLALVISTEPYLLIEAPTVRPSMSQPQSSSVRFPGKASMSLTRATAGRFRPPSLTGSTSFSAATLISPVSPISGCWSIRGCRSTSSTRSG